LPYNLSSPNGILEPVDLNDLSGWFLRELAQIPNSSERSALATIAQDLDSFVQWAGEALLLWPDCDRVPPPGKKLKYFDYPSHIRQIAKGRNIVLDTRQNGPAIASFLLAGGKRPRRFGSANAWSIHHLYSGKFPYCELGSTTHAAKSGNHFTQSAGLIAVHPLADAMVEEFPFFAWLLRARSFLKFGYDPDGVFSTNRDVYGFSAGKCCRIIDPTA
jgi:hypothetical protein